MAPQTSFPAEKGPSPSSFPCRCVDRGWLLQHKEVGECLLCQQTTQDTQNHTVSLRGNKSQEKRHYLCSQDSQQLCTDTLGMLKELCVTFSGCFSHVSKPQVGPSWILGRKREDGEPGSHV